MSFIKSPKSVPGEESLIGAPVVSPESHKISAPSSFGTDTLRPPPTFTARNTSRSLSPKKGSPRKEKRLSGVLPPYAQFVPTNTQQAPIRDPSPEQNAEEIDILTLLAAQERRVLELKEQLAKAEDELQHLRKEWTASQSTRQRNEGRRLHQMRPISMPSAETTDVNEDQDDVWMYEEMQRRKTLLVNTKTSHRRVFSGSRHTKELTLLSPEKTSSDTMTTDVDDDVDIRQSRDSLKKVQVTTLPVRRSESVCNTTEPSLEPSQPNRQNSRSPQREDIIKTGKQVATDLRDGLWTFFEDLRQAAVGDEPRTTQMISRSASQPLAVTRGRTSPTRNSSKFSNRGIPEGPDAGDLFWKTNGLAKPQVLPTASVMRPAKPRTPQKPALQTFDSDGDSWEAWDSPDSPHAMGGNRASSNFSSNGSPNTSLRSSTDTALQYGGQQQQKEREPIPWPSLAKLAPGQLRRTASHLMEELETSLTPPSDELLNKDGEGARREGLLGLEHDELIR